MDVLLPWHHSRMEKSAARSVVPLVHVLGNRTRNLENPLYGVDLATSYTHESLMVDRNIHQMRPNTGFWFLVFFVLLFVNYIDGGNDRCAAEISGTA